MNESLGDINELFNVRKMKCMCIKCVDLPKPKQRVYDVCGFDNGGYGIVNPTEHDKLWFDRIGSNIEYVEYDATKFYHVITASGFEIHAKPVNNRKTFRLSGHRKTEGLPVAG